LTAFVNALFLPDDVIVIRPIETWTEGVGESKKKRSKVAYEFIRYTRAATLASAPGLWAMTLEEAQQAKANVFFGVCPRYKSGKNRKYDRAFQIRVVRALWADLDNCTVDEALRRCEQAGLPRPSIVVKSGHGVHLYWLLAEPYLIDDAGDPPPVRQEWVELADGKRRPRNYVELPDAVRVYEFFADPRTGGDSKKKNPEFPDRLSAKALHVQHVQQGMAKQIGGDHTQDLSRLLRLPFTLNRKDERNGKEPVPCELVECDPARRYAFADFERFAAHSPEKVRAGELAQIRLPKRKLTQGRLDKLGDHINHCITADDRSRADFRLCCFAISQGLDKEEVWRQVAEVGKFGERGRPYFDLTWANAEERVRVLIYDRARQKGAKAGPGTNGVTAGRCGLGAAGGGGDGGPGGPQQDRPGEKPPLPEILGNRRQLPDVTTDALSALRMANDPPTLFQRGNVLTRLRTKSDTGAPYLETLDDSALRGVMARAALWKRRVRTSDGDEEESAPPPMEVVRDLMSPPGWEDIPLIDSVTESPVFGQGGELVVEPGYHARARLWYAPASGLEIPAVSENPSREEVVRARDLLLVDLFGDFPFSDDAGKAHALAAILLPFARRMIDGPTPLHLFDAPVEGTGKTLLVGCITVVASGREPEGFTESANDDEWRKRLTAALEEGGTFLFIDNLNRVLETGALASVLTARTWKDRKLGYTKMLTLPNTAVWLASGNNTRLSRELIRRTVFCRLDARVDAPWERTGFRHPNLLKWVKENRGRLVWAALTLVRAWIAAGRPPGTQVLGMFEAWVATLGGILDVAGVPGLLANVKEFRQSAADTAAEWRAFVTAWWQKHGGEKVGVCELFDLAVDQKLLDGVLGDKGERSQRTRLGVAMGKAADRVFGEYRVERAGEDHKRRQVYRLTPARAQEGGAEHVAGPAGDGGGPEEEVCEWSG
jgi:hypothetical protein